MKTITLREFCLRPASYIKELPITLTSYDKPVACIVPYSDLRGDDKKNLPKIEKEHVQPDPQPVGMKKVETVYAPPQEVYFRQITVAGQKFRVCPHRNESGQCPMGCVDNGQD
jgi:hypothetical protein